MAVTKIWPIKGRLRNVIDYTVNPEKTFNPEYTFEELQALKDVIDYAMESDKTEKQFYVTGVNCTASFAREQMVNTKRLFKKEDGILAFHGYQSFKPGEVTPELAHEIGIKLAEKLWGDRFEVVVSTHLDRHHLHSHFVLNSVSFVDGKKFNACRASYREMRRASDELCREYGLSVIENPHKAPSRMQYLAEKNGEMTKYTNVKRDIQECMAMSYSPEKFEQLMEKRRYTMFFIGDELAINHPFIKSPIRLCDLGEGYSTDEILEFIYNNKHYLKRINVPEQTRVKDIFFDGDVNNSYVTFYDLYSHFVPGLAYVKKYPEKNREVSFYLQKEILKFDKFCEEQNLLCDNDVESYEDLVALKEKTMREYNELINLRKEVRNAIKRADRSGDTQNANELREHNKDITSHLTTLRKHIKICDRVISRDTLVKDLMDELHDYAVWQERNLGPSTRTQTLNDYEQSR